jgi:hypothetical protein
VSQLVRDQAPYADILRGVVEVQAVRVVREEVAVLGKSGGAILPRAGGYFLSDYEEWILDPRYLDDDNVEPIAVNPANYSEMYLRYSTNGRATDWGVKWT